MNYIFLFEIIDDLDFSMSNSSSKRDFMTSKSSCIEVINTAKFVEISKQTNVR